MNETFNIEWETLLTVVQFDFEAKNKCFESGFRRGLSILVDFCVV